MIHDPYIGQAVVSRAGHDIGTAYVITAVEERAFVLVADGRLKTLAAPKKKKCMHLITYPRKGNNGMQPLMRGEQVTDADIRKYLKILAAPDRQDT